MKLYQLQVLTVALVLAFMGGLGWLSENARPLPSGSILEAQCQAAKNPIDLDRETCAAFGRPIK